MSIAMFPQDIVLFVGWIAGLNSRGVKAVEFSGPQRKQLLPSVQGYYYDSCQTQETTSSFTMYRSLSSGKALYKSNQLGLLFLVLFLTHSWTDRTIFPQTNGLLSNNLHNTHSEILFVFLCVSQCIFDSCAVICIHFLSGLNWRNLLCDPSYPGSCYSNNFKPVNLL